MRIVIVVCALSFALAATIAAQQPAGPPAAPAGGARGGAGAAPAPGGAARAGGAAPPQAPPAGGRGAAGAPAVVYKNLTVLPANADVGFAMQVFNEALGVNCLYCHVQGDLASDANPKKDIARKMIGIVRQIDNSFPSSTGVFPGGYHEVDCITCHRGSVKPETKAPKEFYNRGEGARGSPPPDPTPGVNIKALPLDTQVHGGGRRHARFP